MNENSKWTSRDKYPCKDCPNRQPACQDCCEAYKQAKERNEARKEKERKARGLQHDLNGFAVRQARITSGKKQPQR